MNQCVIYKVLLCTLHLLQNLVKPDIVFFGELLPERFGLLSQVDTLDTDFLLVMGTSLAVNMGVNNIISP